ncbi:citrate synthase/methylcitrate synthase [Devosia sp. 63-57]|uniref:citrate synthase/methylcitrate synthase n=1 Tax=Devosia sp. 63-57 TaxID=1895751 RepID=UPI00086ECB68|nr:citrate synthase/methylcitrate synthase [Devosia sp. 63-57]ODT47579.1 MAG: citrate synthase/methylcitrate synthase [Pelagibacterium sp. SCN 63-126]ODU86389.1 MAG: citrate synthase/methylcitrate synthase [Pelagibacterium sp. SCN 63-17]OJX42714.1 MAG: citrate synthase/methylcitrate synthase [Devosia sp. 63-57]
MSGLDDVIAAETVLSEVDGANGRLVICGQSLDALAGKTSYEGVLSLLLAETVDLDTAGVRVALATARLRAFEEVAHLDPTLLSLSITEALRALMARLPDGEDAETALLLIAAPAVFVPAVVRRKAGLGALAPDLNAGHATDMLAMLHGQVPYVEAAAALDTYLVTVSDHGLNASTFAARVVASTRAGYGSAVLAALGALKGPLHGGAPGPVLDMLDAVARPEHAADWIAGELARGERLMGFGHRIYRVRDPRADALKSALARLGAGGGMDITRLALAEAVETEALKQLHAAKPGRVLETNVEFFTALLLEALGFPREAFTGVFAAGRVGGWVAHAHEQIATGRLIRPQSRYIGPKAA